MMLWLSGGLWVMRCGLLPQAVGLWCELWGMNMRSGKRGLRDGDPEQGFG